MSKKPLGLKKLYSDKDWKGFKGESVVPIGEISKDDYMVMSLENGCSIIMGGRTGSGKSTFLHSAVVNLIKTTNPEDLKLILIDLKRVEFLQYVNIPHLLLPVIIDLGEAEKALEWMLDEMKHRIDIIKLNNFESFSQYNEKAPEKLPRIVLIIDECSGLMANNPEFIEEFLIDIVKGGDVLGVNVIISTSKVSAEGVYTKNLIESFSHKIAFTTFYKKDSEVMVGCGGAEKLNLNGEMLVMYPEIEKPRKVRGFYVREEEIKITIEKFKD